jgi:alkylation response protein AidB-like acyl-CoA dehydrogenase
MDFSLTEEQRLLTDSVRKLMARHATVEAVRALDRAHAYPYELYQAWIDAGLLALPFPEALGGAGGSMLDMALMLEELGRTSADFVMTIGASLFCGLNLVRKGTDAQRAEFIPRLLDGRIRMGISMSEPDAGSDLGAMRTLAVRDGDDYVINGQKLWASGVGARDTVINMYVRTEPTGNIRQSMSLFLIDNDTPGLELRKLDMLGRHCTGTYEIFLRDVRVPATRLVGGENQGWGCVLAGLQTERLVAAACDTGTAAAVLDMALDYARERRQFGRPIGSFQAVGHQLADMATEVAAARALTHLAAWKIDQGMDGLADITMAKLHAAETFVRAASRGVQIMGGYGYNKEFEMERHFRDSRAATIAAGTSEIQRNLIAGLLGVKIQ